MGDRAQVRIEMYEGEAPIYLYTHWGGTALPAVVAKALSTRGRWDDPEYLARIVFCTMVSGDVDGETGYGIGTLLHEDIEHPLIILDPMKHTLTFVDHKTRSVLARHTFEDVARAWEAGGGFDYPPT